MLTGGVARALKAARHACLAEMGCIHWGVMKVKDKLHALIAKEVFIKNSEQPIAHHEPDDTNGWIFDFRQILLTGETADDVAKLFLETYADRYPFQVGGLEVAAIPLVTSIVNKLYDTGYQDASGFFIRKSRKKTGLTRMIEGKVAPARKIILVDDLINSGSSFQRQLTVLSELGYNVTDIWTILRFRDDDYYQHLTKQGITLRSVFELNDFTETCGSNVKNLLPKKSTPTPQVFDPGWVFKSKNPNYALVVTKSQPVLDTEKLYFGADNQMFWAINQSDGSVAWRFRVRRGSKGKSIFSNPALHNQTVYFGSYDGNVYALNTDTGQARWIFQEADWVGSSPAVAADLGLLFIGLEFGLAFKRGGIVALDLNTGQKVWGDYTHPALTHCSPLYIKNKKQVAIGSNDGKVRLYDGKTGALVWTVETFGGAQFDTSVDAGFGAGDIKECLAYDPKRDYVIFGSIDGFLYIVNRKDGSIKKHFRCQFAIFSTPLVYNNCVYFTSVDKYLRCLNLDTFELVFETNVDNTRIFASPMIINDRLFIGTNGGKLHELDPKTGERRSVFYVSERITNYPTYNQATNTYFLPTYANEIIQLHPKNNAAD